MSAEIVPANAPEVIAWKTAQRIAATEFVPDALRNRPEAVFAAILYGREIGMGPMQSLHMINVIKGKPTLAPEAMRARVFAAGHLIETVEYGNESVTLLGRRCDSTAQETVTWTLEDAKRAGLLRTGGAWITYPRAMLLARATSELCRLLFPDVIVGASYTPEELGGANPEVVDVEVIEVSGSSPMPEEGEPSPVPTRESAGDGDPEVSANRKRQLQEGIAFLAANKVPVSKLRANAGLPAVDKRLTLKQLEDWETFVTEQRALLETERAPFELVEEATS